VRIRVEPTSAHGLRAQGQITGENGAVVAHRTLSGAAGDCDGLAKAVGVWASLVLDTERAHSTAPEPAPAEAPPTEPPSDFGVADSHAEITWPAPAVLEKPSPEHDWYLHHDDERTVELGVGAFLMMGTGADPLAGASPYVVVEAGNGIFLRPSLAAAESVTSLRFAGDVRATWGTARFDTCLRLPGLYTRHHGIQLDTCGGADLGFTHFGTPSVGVAGSPTSAMTIPFASVGPSIELRGELGGALSIALRGLAGLNLTRTRFYDVTGEPTTTPALSGRIEVALSWRLR
jgi:hypothetical protein